MTLSSLIDRMLPGFRSRRSTSTTRSSMRSPRPAQRGVVDGGRYPVSEMY